MSILAAATQPTPTESVVALVLGLMIATAAVVAAYATGVFRPKALTLPDRYPPYKSAWWLALVSLIGLVAWFGGQTTYVVFVMVKSGNGISQGGFDPENLTPRDYAFLATVPAAAGMAALLVGDWCVGRSSVAAGLGYDAGKLPSGLSRGVLAMVFTFPIVMALGFALEFVYQKVGYEHPKEHELLKALGDSTAPAIRWALIAGAALGAPLFEELFFRGHVQTAVRRWAIWMAGGALDETITPSTRPPAVTTTAAETTFGLQDPAVTTSDAIETTSGTQVSSGRDAAVLSPPLPYLTPPPWAMPAWPSWVAILATSVFFAIVHPLWSAPLIFALSICLGYAYERTNNLWVTITMHAIFNGLQTFLFLKGFGAE